MSTPAAPQPSYAYQDSMPFAREPLKTLYVAQRLLTTLLLVPFWVVKYAVLPRSRRPRASWSLKQIVAVNFTRRIYKVTELAGVTWYTRNPESECDNRTLKETRFEWFDPLPEDLRSGIVVDKQVPFKRVGTFVWPKSSPPGMFTGLDTIASVPSDVEAGAESVGDVPLIGIFLHGGGYCHMSAHEGAGTSMIPRRLSKDKAFTKIYSVEYRLLQRAPFPAAVQDVAAVYAHIIRQHQYQPQDASSLPKSEGSDTTRHAGDTHIPHKTTDHLTADYNFTQNEYHKETEEVQKRVEEAARHTRCKIVLIGDSSGGNLVLATARWIRDEGILPPPHGLLLLSPSCDPSHAFPETPSSYVPRPHGSTDYLVDTPEPRALLQRTFLGHNPLDTVHSPYVSPASRRVLCAFYGAPFAESVESLTIARLDPAARAALRTMASVPGTPFVGEDASPTSLAHPVLASPRGLSLFSEFPRACVVLGDAERLEREVVKLVSAMERDGVDVRTVWVVDGVHDVLMMGWWDERVREQVWRDVEEWVAEVRTSTCL
ncbi:alpha/beta-hydrolase [Amylocystis lapponica]|nr:alpha/beta-hydrolase [Amylocystis lapponica]